VESVNGVYHYKENVIRDKEGVGCAVRVEEVVDGECLACLCVCLCVCVCVCVCAFVCVRFNHDRKHVVCEKQRV